MKIAYEEIIKIQEIGTINSINLNEILSLANKESISPAIEDTKKVLFLGIDFQNDFMDGGALGVPGAHEDVRRVTHFLYKNLHKITKLALSLDTHKPMQIFHQSWWVDHLGNHPNPYTIISSNDIKEGKWRPLKHVEESIEYVNKLEELGKKQLCIWPYHCIEGTFGAALEGQLAKIAYFHAAVRKTDVLTITKGLLPTTEMYGIFRPEYSREPIRNEELLMNIKSFDQIIIAGEAKSHCVLESLVQLLEYLHEEDAPTSNIYVLTDCMTSINGFEGQTEESFKKLAKEYGIHLVQSSEFSL